MVIYIDILHLDAFGVISILYIWFISPQKRDDGESKNDEASM